MLRLRIRKNLRALWYEEIEAQGEKVADSSKVREPK